MGLAPWSRFSGPDTAIRALAPPAAEPHHREEEVTGMPWYCPRWWARSQSMSPSRPGSTSQHYHHAAFLFFVLLPILTPPLHSSNLEPLVPGLPIFSLAWGAAAPSPLAQEQGQLEGRRRLGLEVRDGGPDAAEEAPWELFVGFRPVPDPSFFVGTASSRRSLRLLGQVHVHASWLLCPSAPRSLQCPQQKTPRPLVSLSLGSGRTRPPPLGGLHRGPNQGTGCQCSRQAPFYLA